MSTEYEPGDTPDAPDKPQQPRPEMNFCQEPSAQYLEALEEWGDDPRSVAGAHALKMAGLNGGGWHPDWDSRLPADIPPIDPPEKK